MPQLDLFMFFSSSITIFTYSLFFWSLSYFLLMTILYYHHVFLFFMSQGFFRDIYFFYYAYWLIDTYYTKVLRDIFSYQFYMNLHVYFLIVCLIF